MILRPLILPALVLSLAIFSLSSFSLFATSTFAAENSVEVLAEAAPADDLSDEIAAQLSDSGLRVMRGSRALCEIWPCKTWSIDGEFQPTIERLYPFKPGQLIGVINLRRRGNDFRQQQISRGLYTLRYALQPVDGNHVGTSPTRDFVLLVGASDDTSAETMEMETLQELSAAAAGSTHPAMMCLQRVEEDQASPSLRHNEDRDWWILKLASTAKSDQGERSLPVELVVVGHAEE